MNIYVIIMETGNEKIVSNGCLTKGEVNMELRQAVLEGTLHAFNQKGLKFTMDDIAAHLSISKKTIYTVFKDKEELFLAMVDYLFDGVKECEEKIVNDNNLTTIEKIKNILGAMPNSYANIDFSGLYLLKDKYPKIYDKVELRLETGWERTIELLEQGIAEGVIKKINIPLFKVMFEAALEQFFRRDVLVRNNISYNDALNEVVDVLVNGITLEK